MQCEKDCWKCQVEFCPYTLSQSDELDKEIKAEQRMFRAAGKSREIRYGATPKGYEVKMKAKRKYEKKNPDKVALWNFKSRYKRKHGTSPTDAECRDFLERHCYI